jgi:hypothetical protein
VVKAWHYHKLQTDHFCVVSGMAKVVLFDGRKDSPTQGRIDEFFIGERNRLLISIPPGVYHGYKNIGTAECLLLNIPTELYNYTDPMNPDGPALGRSPRLVAPRFWRSAAELGAYNPPRGALSGQRAQLLLDVSDWSPPGWNQPLIREVQASALVLADRTTLWLYDEDTNELFSPSARAGR